MTDGWTVKEANPAAPEFAQSDSLILRLSRLSRRAFSVFGVGARLSNVNTLFLLQISCLAPEKLRRGKDDCDPA